MIVVCGWCGRFLREVEPIDDIEGVSDGICLDCDRLVEAGTYTPAPDLDSWKRVTISFERRRLRARGKMMRWRDDG